MMEISIIAIIVASISVGIAMATFFHNQKKSKYEKLVYESQFLRDVQSELNRTESDIKNLKDKMDCQKFAWNYLNTMDRVSYFEIKGMLDEKALDYFKNYLKISITIYDWIIEKKILTKTLGEESWPYIIQTCKKYAITPDSSRLQPIFHQYEHIPYSIEDKK